MPQIRQENIPEKDQAFGFPKVIELSLYDKYFVKKAKISLLGYLNNAHHGMKLAYRIRNVALKFYTCLNIK